MRKPVSLVLAVIVLAAGAFAVFHFAKSSPAKRQSSVTTTTTTVPKLMLAPLSGLPDPSGISLKRPALTIKVENTPEALPQWGLDRADVVYEEIVNGGITRLAAIFNSQAPVKVGPVRSVRPTDTQIVWPLGGIFAYSGGAAYAVASISTAPVKLVDESSAASAMFRDPTRYAPHNLFAVAPALFTQFAAGARPVPPPALFSYRRAAQTPIGRPISRFVVPFPSIYSVTWTWNSQTASWDRTLFGQADVTGTGVRESPKNVVVMYVNYVNGIGTEQSYANLQGSGPVAVFSGAKESVGVWRRGSLKSDVITYQTATGQTMTVTPGQTWVEILDAGVKVSITP